MHIYWTLNLTSEIDGTLYREARIPGERSNLLGVCVIHAAQVQRYLQGGSKAEMTVLIVFSLPQHATVPFTS